MRTDKQAAFYGNIVGVVFEIWIGGWVGGGSVFVGGGSGVSVGGGSVFVGGGIGVSVAVGGGGSGVSVGSGVLVDGGAGVRVWVGRGLGVAVARGRRVRVGWLGVAEGRAVAVSEGRGVGEAVSVGTAVGVDTNAVTACCVRAADVLKFATARSTIFNGSMVVRLLLFRSLIASVETLHSRLNPMTPAASTPSGPAYSRTRTLLALLFILIRKGGCHAGNIGISHLSCVDRADYLTNWSINVPFLASQLLINIPLIAAIQCGQPGCPDRGITRSGQCHTC